MVSDHKRVKLDKTFMDNRVRLEKIQHVEPIWSVYQTENVKPFKIVSAFGLFKQLKFYHYLGIFNPTKIHLYGFLAFKQIIQVLKRLSYQFYLSELCHVSLNGSC